MGKTFRPNDSDALRRDLESASPNDTILLNKGIYYLDRIYSFDNLTIQGGDDDATKTIIRPLSGRAFRDKGKSIFKNFSSQGGGSIIEAEGHGTYIENFISWNGNIPVKLAGDDHIFNGGLIYEAGRTGIEINGGFYLIPELSSNPFRLKKEVGLLGETSQEWTQAELKRFEDLFYHRNMNTTVQNVTGIRCGFRGGMTYGAFIKAVPNAGGIRLQNNVGIENINDYWNDFASDQRFYINNNLSVRTYGNAIFIEGYIKDTAKADIYENIVVGAERPLFVSAFPEARSWGNTFYFRDFGKVVHGLTGNREGKNVGCITPEGFEPDKIISLTSKNYRAHQVAATEANYDFSKDELFITSVLDRGPYFVESPTNNLDEFKELGSLPIWEGDQHTPEALEAMIDQRYRLPEVLSVLNQKPLQKSDPVIIPDPDPITTPPSGNNLPDVWIVSDYSSVTDKDDFCAMAFALLCAKDRYNIKGITVGAHPLAENRNPLELYNDTHGKALKEELGIEYPVYLADNWGDRFKNGLVYDESISAIIEEIRKHSSENPLYILNWGPTTEITSLVHLLLETDKDLLKNFVIISHFTAKSTDNNYRKDLEASEYIKEKAFLGDIEFIELDRGGADKIDDKTFPKMDDSILNSKIGHYFGEKWQNNKPDFSDGATLVALAFPELGFGKEWIKAAKKDGTSNLEAFNSTFGDQKGLLYQIIEEAGKEAVNGNVIISPPKPKDLDKILEWAIIVKEIAKKIIDEVS